jgi:hypothetical protein
MYYRTSHYSLTTYLLTNNSYPAQPPGTPDIHASSPVPFKLKELGEKRILNAIPSSHAMQKRLDSPTKTLAMLYRIRSMDAILSHLPMRRKQSLQKGSKNHLLSFPSSSDTPLLTRKGYCRNQMSIPLPPGTFFSEHVKRLTWLSPLAAQASIM